MWFHDPVPANALTDVSSGVREKHVHKEKERPKKQLISQLSNSGSVCDVANRCIKENTGVVHPGFCVSLPGPFHTVHLSVSAQITLRPPNVAPV